MKLHHFLLTVTFVLTFAPLGQGQGQGKCTFPKKLTQRSRWETQMIKERQRTNAFYKFHQTKLEVRDYSSQTKRIMTYTCEEDRGDDTYVLKLVETEPGVEKFFCMQLLYRSEQVIQRKVSQIHMQLSQDICKNLDLDDWPLVWPDMDSQYSQCPFEGGYQIDLREYMHDEPVCETKWLKPRLESECIRGEGLTIDFRHFDCKGNLEMDLLQKLACLGSWEDGDFIFTILTDQDDLWPRLWLMRLPRENALNEPIHSVLSMDIVADRRDYYGSDGRVPLERVYEVVMTMEVYPSLCENEAAMCENKCGRDDSKMYCQKDCGVCDPSMELNKCKFPEEALGEWQEIHDEGVRGITVTESMLYTADLLPFQCYELHADEWYEGMGRQAMVSIFKNGCKPRFTCAEFQSKASHVLSYRLSQSVVWPATIQVNAGEVCGEDRFKKDPEPLLDKYRSQENKILIKKTTNRQTVPCELDTSMGLTGLAKDGKRLLGVLWNAVIGYEDQSHTILHETCPDDSTPHKSRTLRCLASYRYSNETQFIIMEEDGNEENVECWVIHSYPWETRPRALVLSPSHCSIDMPIQVDFGNDLHFLSKYEVLELGDDIKDPCSKWKSSTPQPPIPPQISITRPTPADSRVDVEVDVSAKMEAQKESKPDEWKVKVGGLSSGQVQVQGKLWLMILIWLIVNNI